MFRRYHESGLSVIPLKPKSKAPIPMAWSKYCSELPSDEEIDAWEELFQRKQCGIGLCLGEASRIIALDIDTDNPETLKSAPQSPVVKRGQRGETRFFRYNPHLSSKALKDKGVDLLSTGKQTVLPPSIHPTTLKPYHWLTHLTLLDIEAEDLPELLQSDIDLLPNIFQDRAPLAHEVGRNNKLKDIVTSMRARGEPEELIVDEIYNYDKEHHSPQLFTDTSEGFGASNDDEAKMNALIFCCRVTQSLAKKNIVILPQHSVITVGNFDQSKVESFQYKAPPTFSGFIQRFNSLAVAASKFDCGNIALGGALTVLATAASNRFRVGSTWPNLYVLNIARSGAGKMGPQTLAQQLLSDTGLLGSGNYKSGAGLYSRLPEQQERLDIIDEVSSLFRSISRGESYQADMQEVLCNLYSVSNSEFLGVYLKGTAQEREKTKSRGVNDGACFNPCVNILASTTPMGFKESCDKAMASKGLLPRFLIFNQHSHGTYKPYTGFLMHSAEVRVLKEMLLEILRIPKREALSDKDPDEIDLSVVTSRGKKFDPIDHSMDKASHDLLIEFDREYSTLGVEDDSEETGPFYARFGEQATKLSLLIALSEGKSSIDVECVSKAIDIVIMQFHNSQLLRTQLVGSNSSRQEVLLDQALALIQEKGRISYATFTRNKVAYSLNKKELTDMIDKLERTGLVRLQKGEKHGQSFVYVGKQG